MTKDELDGILARLRHLICEIEEVIDDIEKLKGDNYDSKGIKGNYRETGSKN